MSDWKMYLAITGSVLIPAGCLILVVLLLSHWNPPEQKRQNAAHAEALTYLGDVILRAAEHSPNSSVISDRVVQILEVLEYPRRGNVCDWESKVAATLYGRDGEPSQPWDRVLAEYFEFARENLYCGFVKEHNLASYERVRACLTAVGVEVKPGEDLSLGRL